MLSRRSFFLFLIATFTTLLPATLRGQGFTYSPTTTLTAEVANNTSAPDSFAGQANGNAAAGNVSKLPIRSLLYDGSTTKVFAHFMPWFGQANHLDIGYDSRDIVQVEKQVDDMLSRGIEGIVIDWYGPNFLHENTATLRLMQEAETRGGNFVFAVMEDVGALNSCGNTPGCDVTQRLIDDLNYANDTFYSSTAYMRHNGRPVVFFFGVDKYTIDWDRARANLLGNPLLIFQGNSGLSHKQSDGAFSWIAPNASNPDDEGLTYLDNFFNAAKTYSGALVFGSAYPGFDNSLAPWVPSGTGKKMKQKCGQTWLNSLARAGNHFSSSDQLYAMQLVTWNDYEEGTEVESGVDNCIALSASVTGSTLNWALTGSGQENTIDHYTVFISSNGQNLMPLADVASGTHSLNLAPFAFAPESQWQLFVKAVGKASIHNQMSNSASYTAPAAGPPNLAKTASVSVSSQNASAGQTGAKAIDGVVSGCPVDCTKEWVTRGQLSGAWIQLNWASAVQISQIVLHDRINSTENVRAGKLTFSSGAAVTVGTLPNDGSGLTVNFSPRNVKWVRFRVNSAVGTNIGLAEIEAFNGGASAPAATLSGVTLNPGTVTGGTSSQGTVTLSAPAPSGGISVALSGSNASAATVPASVTVSAGNTSANFTVTTSSVTTQASVTITATYSGTSKTAALTVNPAALPSVSLTALTLNPTTVNGGSTSQGTVTLSGAAPAGGVVVSLSSSNTNRATVPASVTVPAGASSASFTVNTTGSTTTTQVTISGAYSGVNKSAALTVRGWWW